MAQLAIKGHPTRGKEVIQLLEMLGADRLGYKDTFVGFYYYIECDVIVSSDKCPIDAIVFTLEEFEEKFPYKVDDVVVNHKYGKGDITRMLWIDNEIVYEIHFEGCMAYCKANELCKYDAFKGLLSQELKEYLSHATREELDKTMEEIEIALAPFKVGDKVIVKGYEGMGEDEIICVFKTYDGDIKYKTKNHLNAHYFMEDSFTRVEKINKAEIMELTMKNKSKLINIEPKLVGNECVHFPIPIYMKLEVKDGMCYLYRDCGEQCKREGVNLQRMERKLDEALAKETPESLNKWLDEENMEKRLEPVYELGTGKILYYVEKVSGEKYCPIGETTLYIQDGYEFRDETNNVINAKRITLVRKQPQYPKTYEELIEPKFKVGDIITKRDSIENSWVVSSVSSEYYGLQLPKGSEGIGTLPIIEQDKYELVLNKFDVTTLVPFESKVLVRDTNTDKWRGAFYSHYKSKKFYIIGDSYYYQCIPYEGNEYLLDTTNDCDNYYKNW